MGLCVILMRSLPLLYERLPHGCDILPGDLMAAESGHTAKQTEHLCTPRDSDYMVSLE
jgi:hypothetical protein